MDRREFMTAVAGSLRPGEVRLYSLDVKWRAISTAGHGAR